VPRPRQERTGVRQQQIITGPRIGFGASTDQPVRQHLYFDWGTPAGCTNRSAVQKPINMAESIGKAYIKVILCRAGRCHEHRGDGQPRERVR
jgi:hypothetical protein